MPKHCQSCGALLDDNAAFCGGCGAKAVRYTDFLTKTETSDDSQDSRQPEDREAFREDAALLEQDSVMLSYQRAARKRTAAVLIILLIVALTLFVILPLANVDVFGLHLFGAGTKTAVTEATEAAAPSETVHETLFPSGLI